MLDGALLIFTLSRGRLVTAVGDFLDNFVGRVRRGKCGQCMKAQFGPISPILITKPLRNIHEAAGNALMVEASSGRVVLLS